MCTDWDLSPLQVSALLDNTSKEDFIEEVAEEYEEIREEYRDSLQDQKMVPLQEARDKAFTIDWSQFNAGMYSTFVFTYCTNCKHYILLYMIYTHVFAYDTVYVYYIHTYGIAGNIHGTKLFLRISRFA